MIVNRNSFPELCRLLVAALLVIGVMGHRTVFAEEAGDPVAAAYDRAGMALFEGLKEAPGNLVLSPLGIGTVLSMAQLGAGGETEREMSQALWPDLASSTMSDGALQLQSKLQSQARSSGATLDIANALHLTRFGERVAPAYRQLLAKKFAAEVLAGSDLATLNGWVRDRTHGKIASILENLDPLSVCVLLNAVSFKAEWARKFDASSTRDGDFRIARDETVKVPMMQRDGDFSVVRAHTFDAIALPYKDSSLTMVIMLPMAGIGAYPLPAGLSFESFNAILSGLKDAKPERARLRMPRFRIETDLNLVPRLQAVGITLAFDPNRADFSGITNSMREDDRIHISQARHKALIEVNEEGTEAAAASAVGFALRASRPPDTRIDIDRPFLFYLVDTDTRSILFMGRVMDPRSAAGQAQPQHEPAPAARHDGAKLREMLKLPPKVSP